MTEKSKLEETNKDLIRFVETASEIFDTLLDNHGFKNEIKEVENSFCTMIYKRDDLYIKISASIHPRDYPYYYNIIIGQGSTDWPETDWNSIALWHIKKEISPELKAKEYSLVDFDKIDFSLKNAKCELEKYGDSFLNGELTTFEKVRQAINQQREPYKIHQKDQTGRFKTIIDSVSKKLKERFS